MVMAGPAADRMQLGSCGEGAPNFLGHTPLSPGRVAHDCTRGSRKHPQLLVLWERPAGIARRHPKCQAAVLLVLSRWRAPRVS